MIRAEDRTAPSYPSLRPLREPTSPGFPVHAELAQALARPVDPTDPPDPTMTHVLAVCAGYAYADADVVSMIMARMGLPDNHCRQVEMRVDPMFIVSTAHLVQSHDGRVVLLAYRGTEPLNCINWLTDADLLPEKIGVPFPEGDPSYAVHAGFYRNVRATRYEVVAALQRALEGRSVLASGERLEAPLEALYVTGHSLGGAMAALMGIMLVRDPTYAALAERLRAVVTFGQPMLATPGLAAACDADPFLGRRVLRYVYGDDVVPHLPPCDAGEFAHFGRELVHRDGQWRPSRTTHQQMRSVLLLAEAPLSFLARRLRVLHGVPFTYSIDDHLPHRYVTALTPPGVSSEYGGDPLSG